MREPTLNTKTNIILDAQYIDHSLRTYQDQKHFTFNKTNYIIINQEDKSFNKNYGGLLDKTQQKLLENELQLINNKL